MSEDDRVARPWRPTPDQVDRYLARELELGRINVAVLLERRYSPREILFEADYSGGSGMSPATIRASLRSLNERPLTELERREISRRNAIARHARRREEQP